MITSLRQLRDRLNGDGVRTRHAVAPNPPVPLPTAALPARVRLTKAASVNVTRRLLLQRGTTGRVVGTAEGVLLVDFGGDLVRLPWAGNWERVE